MPRPAAALSELLSAIELSGRTWAYVDFAVGGGFSVGPGDAVLVHAVLHGAVRVTAPGGGTQIVAAGEAVFVVGGEAHAVRLAPDSAAVPLEFLREERGVDAPDSFAVGAAGPALARVLSGRIEARWPAGTSRASLPSLLRVSPGALVEPVALAHAGIGAGSSAVLTRLAAAMLVARLRADPQCRRWFAPERPDPVREALRRIASNPSAAWTVERLARSVGMGRSNFAAQFTAQVGRAPMELVAEARMDHAADLLRQGDLKIAEIAELAGYGSQAAFSRRFTRHFGISPGQMREAARAAQPVAGQLVAWRPLLGGGARRDPGALARLRGATGVAAQVAVPRGLPRRGGD